jgi:SHS2 domain-containing protein
VRLEELDHTADVGFEVTASSLDVLFQGAALGLFRALGLDDALSPPTPTLEPEPFSLDAPDGERLLVAWLRELLWTVQSERRRPVIREVSVARGDGRARLEASIDWRGLPSRPTREVKGITYHGLRLEPTEEGWSARIVLDV